MVRWPASRSHADLGRNVGRRMRGLIAVESK